MFRNSGQRRVREIAKRHESGSVDGAPLANEEGAREGKSRQQQVSKRDATRIDRGQPCGGSKVQTTGVRGERSRSEDHRLRNFAKEKPSRRRARVQAFSQREFLTFQTFRTRERNFSRKGETRLFQNQPLDDGKPPKKAYTHTKTRVKPPPTKVMVKRDANKETWTENDSSVFEPRQQWSTMKKLRKMSLNEDEEEENDKENEVEPPLVRTKRYVRIPHSGQSPHTVSYAANYNEQENKGWVKPLFSSIVYRLPVRNPHFLPFFSPTINRISNPRLLRISKKPSSSCCCW